MTNQTTGKMGNIGSVTRVLIKHHYGNVMGDVSPWNLDDDQPQRRWKWNHSSCISVRGEKSEITYDFRTKMERNRTKKALQMTARLQ